MDRKQWYSGGEPNINIGDLTRDTNSLFEALGAVFAGIKTQTFPNYIIHGCKLTVNAGVDASVTEGYILLNGEILKVDAQTVAAGSTDEYAYEKVITYDANGQKIYNNGVTRETWVENRAVLVNTAVLPVPSTSLDAKGLTMLDHIRQSMRGTIIEAIASHIETTRETRFVKAGINGTGTYDILLPVADDENVQKDFKFVTLYENLAGGDTVSYTVKDLNGVVIDTINKIGLYIYYNNGTSWLKFTGLQCIDFDAQQAPNAINIGSWNINSTGTISIAHGISNWQDIKRVDAKIINDDEDTYFNFTDTSGGFIYWDDTNIYLERANATRFDSTDFQSTAIDRGVIYIYQ